MGSLYDRHQKDKAALLEAIAKLDLKPANIISSEEPSHRISDHYPQLGLDDKLCLAILLDPIEVVEELLELGADPKMINKKGLSGFTLALAHGRQDIARLLR